MILFASLLLLKSYIVNIPMYIVCLQNSRNKHSHASTDDKKKYETTEFCSCPECTKRRSQGFYSLLWFGVQELDPKHIVQPAFLHVITQFQDLLYNKIL